MMLSGVIDKFFKSDKTNLYVDAADEEEEDNFKEEGLLFDDNDKASAKSEKNLKQNLQLNTYIKNPKKPIKNHLRFYRHKTQEEYDKSGGKNLPMMHVTMETVRRIETNFKSYG